MRVEKQTPKMGTAKTQTTGRTAEPQANTGTAEDNSGIARTGNAEKTKKPRI
jgi:hypothetical protein